MITLEHQGPYGFFIEPMRGAGGARHFDVFVDENSVVDDFDEFSVRNFFAGGVETRRAEINIEGLPGEGRQARTNSGFAVGRQAIIEPGIRRPR